MNKSGEEMQRARELKAKIVAAVCVELSREVDTKTRSALAAHDAATHAEAKPENDKDTRSVEAAYLAGAQAARASEALERIAQLRAIELPDFSPQTPIASGALITVDEEGERSELLLLPVGGGSDVEVEGVHYRTITPTSPLGSVLLGAIQGDAVELRTPRGLRELAIEAVR